MENKDNKIGIIVLLSIFSILFISLFIYGIVMSNKEVSEPIPDVTTKTSSKKQGNNDLEEVATFHGGAGEVTYQTTIYKIDNGHANYGFEYKNETCTTKSWGSSESVCRTTKSGSFTWTDEAFTVAKDNYAYSYVTVPNSDDTYSISEFQRIFMMD